MTDHLKEVTATMARNRQRINDLTDTYIKKLVVSTGIYDCITDPYDALKNGDPYSSVMPDLERFALLTIKECITEIEGQRDGGREIADSGHNPDWNDAISCVSAMIKHKFGVTP